ncbi:MAG: DUF5686 and carboxypeptidase regulatory-like domain-containing protein [Bacteroidia bacterium]|nr:DUF5686 and carboxypeptidase regulatory-like domain-containing protein [Bacteroidia bacterium]
MSRHTSCIFLFLLLIVTAGARGQTHVITGEVRDASTREGLAFAHVFVVENASGVVTNKEGLYRLQLPPGSWTIRVSSIGYESKTRRFTVQGNESGMDFALRPRTYTLDEVTVTPDDSLARLIVTRARLAREQRQRTLHSYHMRAHNKVYSRIDSTWNMSKELEKDLKASFLDIAETQTEAWFACPNKRKEKVHARQQSDLFKEMGRNITSGFARMDCSQEELGFYSASITGPISEAGLDDVYYYSVAGVSEGERLRIWRIRVLPRSRLAAAVSGYYYIEDSTWSITQVDLRFTPEACAVILPMMSSFTFRQQFSLYEERFWLPSAANLQVQGYLNLMGMKAWLSLEGSSVIAEYICNPPDIAAVFDDYQVEVLPTADSFTSDDWELRRLQPRSLVDDTIYMISDSVAQVRAAKMKDYNLGHVVTGKELQQGDLISQIPGLVEAVQFNRVEGLSIGFPYASTHVTDRLRSWSASLRYGFLDRRPKGSGNMQLSLGSRDRSQLTVSAFHDLAILYRDEPLLNTFFVTSMILLDRFDAFDYYYRSGGRLLWETHPLPWLKADLGVEYSHAASASKHSDWSLVGEGTYLENPPINDGSAWRLKLGLRGDFRNRTLEADGVHRAAFKPSDLAPDLWLEYRSFSIAGAEWDVFIPGAAVGGGYTLGTLGSGAFRLSWQRSTAQLPVQDMLTLPGSETWMTAPFRFRTLALGEFGGDEQATVFLEHNFGKLPFLLLGLPSMGLLAADVWELRIFAAAGWTRMREASAVMLTREIRTATRPLFEAGLSLDRVFGLLRVDVGHRLTQLNGGKQYFLGISINP